MKISPMYTTDDWAELDLSDPTQNESGWQTAVDIFVDRIGGRFLNIVECIQAMSFSGFAVMAIECLLIETLEQFQRGVPFGSRSFESFDRFLAESSFFQGNLRSKKQRYYVYDHFRNGIFHQAELKGASRVHRYGPLAKPAEEGPGLIINRKRFHDAIKWTFNDYVCKLRKHNPADLELRWKFRAKMDYICRMPQFYLAYRDDASPEKINTLLKEFGPVIFLGSGIVNGWRKAKKKKDDMDYWIIQEDQASNFSGPLYQVNVFQLDKIAKEYEKCQCIIPVRVESQSIKPWQPVWVFRSR